ncbi:hypothetical protein HU200_047018 [Digitaria exilis]|uniref:Uncharacterized protein n=1 Tax=Digitaria exilis TaxID=1010633 RepID=A0A835AVL5_9POAL|nr:hypothetical protein HU200_047018 [Digitaria exilis]
MVLQARRLFGLSIFREVAIIATWCIWTHRKAIIFYGAALSMVRRRIKFTEDFNCPL